MQAKVRFCVQCLQNSEVCLRAVPSAFRDERVGHEWRRPCPAWYGRRMSGGTAGGRQSRCNWQKREALASGEATRRGQGAKSASDRLAGEGEPVLGRASPPHLAAQADRRTFTAALEMRVVISAHRDRQCILSSNASHRVVLFSEALGHMRCRGSRGQPALRTNAAGAKQQSF